MLITGPGLGPEGSRAERGGFDLRVIPQLWRNIYRWQDWTSYCTVVRISKAGVLGRAAAATLGIPAVHTIYGPSFHPGQAAL